MFRRSALPKITLALLGLFLLVSVAEAAECDPCRSKARPACSSCPKTGASDAEGDRDPGSAPSRHAGGDGPRAVCPFCLSPCIESSPIVIHLESPARFFDPPESAMVYEAPSFPFLRPPRI